MRARYCLLATAVSAILVTAPNAGGATPAGTRLTIALAGKWTEDQARAVYGSLVTLDALAADHFLSTTDEIILNEYSGTSNNHFHSIFIPQSGGTKCWSDNTFSPTIYKHCYSFHPFDGNEFEVMLSVEQSDGMIHHSFLVHLEGQSCSVPEAYIWWTKNEEDWARFKDKRENATVPSKLVASDVRGTCYYGGSKLN